MFINKEYISNYSNFQWFYEKNINIYMEDLL